MAGEFDTSNPANGPREPAHSPTRDGVRERSTRQSPDPSAPTASPCRANPPSPPGTVTTRHVTVEMQGLHGASRATDRQGDRMEGMETWSERDFDAAQPRVIARAVSVTTAATPALNEAKALLERLMSRDPKLERAISSCPVAMKRTGSEACARRRACSVVEQLGRTASTRDPPVRFAHQRATRRRRRCWRSATPAPKNCGSGRTGASCGMRARPMRRIEKYAATYPSRTHLRRARARRLPALLDCSTRRPI